MREALIAGIRRQPELDAVLGPLALAFAEEVDLQADADAVFGTGPWDLEPLGRIVVEMGVELKSAGYDDPIGVCSTLLGVPEEVVVWLVGIGAPPERSA